MSPFAPRKNVRLVRLSQGMCKLLVTYCRTRPRSGERRYESGIATKMSSLPPEKFFEPSIDLLLQIIFSRLLSRFRPQTGDGLADGG